MTAKMSKRGEQIYRILFEHQHDPFGPTYEYLCERLGTKSKSTVHRHMKRLEDQGYVRCKHGGHGGRNHYVLTGKSPIDLGGAAHEMWVLETAHLKDPTQRVFQPLTLTTHRVAAGHGNLTRELLADPSRKAKWQRVKVIILPADEEN